MSGVCKWCRLGVKILSASLAIEVLMLLLLLASTSAVSNSRLEALFHLRLDEVGKLFNASLSGPLASQDLATLQDVLDALRNEEAISYLVLVNNRGQRVAASGWAESKELPQPMAKPVIGKRFDASLPITLAASHYGTLHYGVETALLAEAQQTLLARGALIAGLEVLLSAIALSLISLLLTRRLVRLSEAAETIAKGDLSIRVPVGDKDEVGKLAVSFNAMADALYARMRALALSEEKFSKAFSGSPDAMIITDSESHILDVNAAFERIFAMPRREALGAQVSVLCAADCAQALDKIIGSPDSISGSEIVLTRGDGKMLSCLISSDNIELAGSACRISILRDISARKEIEAALERSNHDLEQFAYVSSHDLREPLRMISSYVSLLERRYADKLDDDAREFIAYAKDGAERMNRLILDLLDYSRATRDDKPFAAFNLSSALQGALDNMQLLIGESQATITNDGALPQVAGNITQITRLFQNLIGNAIKYRSPDRPLVISIKAAPSDHQWTISVADNGIGIDQQYFERIFMIFQRLHGRGVYEGTGIGLAVCKRIVEHHKGRIWVKSEPGVGSTFLFTLPAIDGTP
ncbi:putative Histidine kinase [Rhodospirillaceae bacterium LM-1]|nr:putative Histidine kinase [Rhodospirillaceae bacterium LM-1]